MENLLATSAVSGAVVGFILALTGAGGAVLAVPLLLFVLHLSMADAAPIALLAVGLSAALGTLIGLRTGIVRYRAAALMAAVGASFSPMGLWLAHRIPNEPLTLLFAAVLAFIALKTYRQAITTKPHAIEIQLSQPCQLDAKTGRFVWSAACTQSLTLSGISAGFLSGLLGVGGGFVIVPALKKATNAPMQVVVATSLAVITLVSASGVISTAITGHMNWQVGIPFAAGAMFAMLSGRLIVGRLSGQRLQQGFALVAGLVAIGLIVKVVLNYVES